jgi:predicted Rossmann fold flavoprotein
MAGQTPPVTVIGAGAAGIIAAWRASTLGVPVLLLERNRRAGIKILISGGGRCNITHAGSIEELLQAFRLPEARFLKPSFHRFTNEDIVRIIESGGVPTATRPDGRVFPERGTARQVMQALEGLLVGVRIRTGVRVTGIDASGGRATGLRCGEEFLLSSHIVVATGGASYPKTGTTGDGVAWLAALGHAIVPLRPALAPVAVTPAVLPQWRGVALRSGRLSAYAEGTRIAARTGDLLFTHEGLSGPAVLEISRTVAEQERPVRLEWDFFPGRDFAALDGDLTAMARTRQGKMIGSLLEEILPNRIVQALCEGAGVVPGERCHALRREARRALVRTLKGWPLGTVASIPMERGEVSAGGVALSEVDPHSMRSRRVKGLYACGELLDVAGPVGGYNLQAAFSTGFVAGESAACDWLGEFSPAKACL